MKGKQEAIKHLCVEIAAPQWKRWRGLAPQLEKAAALALKHLPASLKPAARRAEFTLLLTADAEVRRLNHDFRGVNKPTNVLSFPHYTRTQLIRLGKCKKDIYAGDIAVAYKYTADEARKENKTLGHHLIHLLIHGVLHLFGYDHLTAAAAARMERLEKKLMAELGLPDPYAPADLKKRNIRRKKKPRT